MLGIDDARSSAERPGNHGVAGTIRDPMGKSQDRDCESWWNRPTSGACSANRPTQRYIYACDATKRRGEVGHKVASPASLWTADRHGTFMICIWNRYNSLFLLKLAERYYRSLQHG